MAKPIADQLIDFISRRKDKFNQEPYAVFEFVVQAGRLDGVRVKEYIKADKRDAEEIK